MRSRIIVVAAWALAQSGAFAQAPTGGPPMPRTPDQPTTWLYWAVIGALAGATITIAIMPSKRGHMD